MKRYRLNKERFTEFLAGVAYVAVILGCTIAILLKL